MYTMLGRAPVVAPQATALTGVSSRAAASPQRRHLARKGAVVLAIYRETRPRLVVNTDSRTRCGGTWGGRGQRDVGWTRPAGRGVDAASGTEEADWAWRRRNVGGRIYRGERD